MSCSAQLGSATWTELDGRDVTVLLPLGSLEQHGPHLPLDTDTRIAAAVVSRAVVSLAEGSGAEGSGAEGSGAFLAAPELPYGASGEHEDFPGTVSIGHVVLEELIVEYARSACRWASRVVVVNGHGGNTGALDAAVHRVRTEGRDVAWFACAAAGSDPHAGHTETSMLLHLSAPDVRMDRARTGNTASLHQLWEPLRSNGVRSVSESGVLGDPTTASPSSGAEILDAMARRLDGAVRRWDPDDHGRLR